jgi:hypothetical protein
MSIQECRSLSIEIPREISASRRASTRELFVKRCGILIWCFAPVTKCHNNVDLFARERSRGYGLEEERPSSGESGRSGTPRRESSVEEGRPRERVCSPRLGTKPPRVLEHARMEAVNDIASSCPENSGRRGGKDSLVEAL